MKWSIDDPGIRAILTGVYHSGSTQIYYRINPDGSHRRFSVRKETNKLGVGHPTLTRLLREAVEIGLVIVGKFQRKPKPPKPKKEKPPSVPQTAELRRAENLRARKKPEPKPPKPPKPEKPVSPKNEPGKKPGPKKQEPAEPVNDDGEEHPLRLKGFNRRRYCLVEQGDFYGVWDRWDCCQRLISRDLDEALEEIDRLNQPKPAYYPSPHKR